MRLFDGLIKFYTQIFILLIQQLIRLYAEILMFLLLKCLISMTDVYKSFLLFPMYSDLQAINTGRIVVFLVFVNTLFAFLFRPANQFFTLTDILH